MTKFPSTIVKTISLLSIVLVGCSGNSNSSTTPDQIDEGTLKLVVNGEDFVRNGFVTKDDWQINFERVAVNVGNVMAYQTESTFDPENTENTENIEYQETVTILDEAKTVDLTENAEAGEPVAVEQVQAVPGSYNALSWELIPSNETGLENQTIVMQGKATKDGETVNFNLGFSLPVTYLCGEFVGDMRKGIVKQDAPAEVEMTLHFDHVFGDAGTPMTEAINQDALGFQPLAELAQAGELTADWQTLQQQLSPENQEILTKAIIGLGHVGEGHCKAEYKQ